MRVIIGAANGFGDTVDVFNDASEIGMQSITPRRCDDALTVLGAEDQMLMEGKMGGWQVLSIMPGWPDL